MSKIISHTSPFKFLLFLAAMLCSAAAGAQSNDFPKDTSYTIRSAAEKILKHHPSVRAIAPKLPKGVREQRNVVYAKTGDRSLHVDIFYPAKKRKKGYPGVLLIHGGGWRSGSKDMEVPMAQQLAAKGYVAVAVEYRLSLEAPYPAAVYDLKAAVRWMRAHAAEYRLDTTRMAAYGCSAGAQLASLLGTTGGMARFEGSEGYQDHSSAVQAVLNIDGIVSFVHQEASAEGTAASQWLGGSRDEKWEVWKDASPLEYAGAGTPPFLFVNSSVPRFHAGRDDMVRLLDGLKIYNEVHTIPESPHSFWVVHPWFDQTLQYAADFLDKVF
ncbi:MAG: alpha/beta hydrolase [Saprospiraceae bacterium]